MCCTTLGAKFRHRGCTETVQAHREVLQRKRVPTGLPTAPPENVGGSGADPRGALVKQPFPVPGPVFVWEIVHFWKTALLKALKSKVTLVTLRGSWTTVVEQEP